MNAIGYAMLVFVISEVILSIVQKWLNNGGSPDKNATTTRIVYSLMLAIGTLLIMWGK